MGTMPPPTTDLAPARVDGAMSTFLFTDIEGSTRLWEEHADHMGASLAEHDRLLRAAIEGRGGTVIKTTGDGLLAVFADPDGSDGDTALKTRLASGDITDLFWYNSGSLLQALNPVQTLADTPPDPFTPNTQESYLPPAPAGSAISAAPAEPAMAGGILYNKKIYADNGL